VRLPRSGPELLQRIAERWRWFLYRVRFHPWTTNELPRILGTFGDYIDLTRLNRPSDLAASLATLWAVWIAGRGKPDPRIFIVFVTGTVLMRSAGCAVNDYADRSFDPHVARTPSGRWPRAHHHTEALILFGVLALASLTLVCSSASSRCCSPSAAHSWR